MRRIFGPQRCVLSLASFLLFSAGCSQGVGGRCEISSDCSSGLTCKGSNGNGTCEATSPIVDTGVGGEADSPAAGSPDTVLDASVSPSMDSSVPDALEADALEADALVADLLSSSAEAAD